MSGNCYQTLVVQHSVSNQAWGVGSAKARKGKPYPVQVPLSQETAETLQKVSEATRLTREILAAEAMMRLVQVLLGHLKAT